MSNRLGGKQGTAYLGTNAQQPPNWNFYPHDPTIYTYQNFSLGDLWLNTVTQQAFVLVSLERNTVTNEFNAIWTDFTGTAAGVVESLQAADGTVAFPVNGQIDFPSTVIAGNTNSVTNILTSAQPNNGGNFLINLTPQISLRNDTNGVDSITLEQISVSGGAWNSTLKFLRADGTIAAPTAVSNNFGLGSVRWFGYTGSGYTANPSACIKSLVKGAVVDNPNPALSAVPACIAFAVSETQLTSPFDLNSLDIKLQIDPDGQVNVKNGNLVVETPPTPGAALTVNGVNTPASFSTIIQANVAAGTHNALELQNSNAGAGSSCRLLIKTNNQVVGTGGDPFIGFLNTGAPDLHYTMGQDTSAEQFVLSKNSTLGANNIMTVTNSNNQINYPQQSSFFAYPTANQSNVTGNAAGTPYVVQYTSTAATIGHNIGGHYNTGTGIYTAPIDGRYLFTAAVFLFNIVDPGMTTATFGFNKTPIATGLAEDVGFQNLCNPLPIVVGGNLQLQATIMLQLAAGDQIKTIVLVQGGAGNTVSVIPPVAPAGPPKSTFFAGQLLS